MSLIERGDQLAGEGWKWKFPKTINGGCNMGGGRKCHEMALNGLKMAVIGQNFEKYFGRKYFGWKS